MSFSSSGSDHLGAFRRVSSKQSNQETSLIKTPTHLSEQPLGQQINWINCVIVFGTPLIAIIGLFITEIHLHTVLFAVVYYYITGFGVTAGYHRCWSHQSFKATVPLEVFLMLAASGALQGSSKYWSHLHRAHHRWTDTDKDPYNFQRGFFYAHFGWLLFHCDRINRCVDIADLKSNPIVAWQHKYYAYLGPFMTFFFPALLCHFLWNDWRGGFFIVGALRCAILHQGTWCVNSVAHSDVFFGKAPFDDTISPRDSLFTALLTFGEGYHNFHHEFPNDYRNGIRWYHYDPTKWLLRLCKALGLAYDLKTFSENEIRRGQCDMTEKKLMAEKMSIDYGVSVNTLPVWTKDEFEKQCAMQPRNVQVVINNVIHDVTKFVDEHPGGAKIIKHKNGKDATKEFNGSVYNHSNAARNLLSHYRVARLHVE